MLAPSLLIKVPTLLISLRLSEAVFTFTVRLYLIALRRLGILTRKSANLLKLTPLITLQNKCVMKAYRSLLFCFIFIYFYLLHYTHITHHIKSISNQFLQQRIVCKFKKLLMPTWYNATEFCSSQECFSWSFVISILKKKILSCFCSLIWENI